MNNTVTTTPTGKGMTFNDGSHVTITYDKKTDTTKEQYYDENGDLLDSHVTKGNAVDQDITDLKKNEQDAATNNGGNETSETDAAGVNSWFRNLFGGKPAPGPTPNKPPKDGNGDNGDKPPKSGGGGCNGSGGGANGTGGSGGTGGTGGTDGTDGGDGTDGSGDTTTPTDGGNLPTAQQGNGQTSTTTPLKNGDTVKIYYDASTNKTVVQIYDKDGKWLKDKTVNGNQVDALDGDLRKARSAASPDNNGSSASDDQALTSWYDNIDTTKPAPNPPPTSDGSSSGGSGDGSTGSGDGSTGSGDGSTGSGGSGSSGGSGGTSGSGDASNPPPANSGGGDTPLDPVAKANAINKWKQDHPNGAETTSAVAVADFKGKNYGYVPGTNNTVLYVGDKYIDKATSPQAFADTEKSMHVWDTMNDPAKWGMTADQLTKWGLTTDHGRVPDGTEGTTDFSKNDNTTKPSATDVKAIIQTPEMEKAGLIAYVTNDNHHYVVSKDTNPNVYNALVSGNDGEGSQGGNSNYPPITTGGNTGGNS